MGVDTRWENDEKTAARLVVSDPWDWNKLHKGLHMAAILLVNVDHLVHLMVDFSQTVTMPKGAIAHLRSLGKKNHERWSGHVVVIGVPHDVLSQITGSPERREVTLTENTVYFVDTEDDAQTILNSLEA